MQDVPLASTPNQELSVTPDGVRFVLRLKSTNGVMVADVSVNGVTVLSASRVLAGEPVIPYTYLEAGNFILLTTNDELPDYEAFGASQSLVYLSAGEIAAL